MKKIQLLIIVALLSGCASLSPLQQYVRTYDYLNFNPPRNSDGAGTIIDFKNKSESIVARADQCILSSPETSSQIRRAALEKTNYTLESNSSLELSLPKAITEYVDLSATIGRNGIKSVSIELIDPFEETISRFDVSSYLKALGEDSVCRPFFSDKDNFVISQALGVKGISYTFRDNNSNKVEITSEILENVKLNPSHDSKYIGNTSLIFNEKVYIGYRAWLITESSGLIGETYEISDLSQSQLLEKRNESN